MGNRRGLYEGFTRWLDRHLDTFIEIVICLALLAVGVIVGYIMAIARIAGEP